MSCVLSSFLPPRPLLDGFHFEINCFSIGPCHCQSRCQWHCFFFLPGQHPFPLSLSILCCSEISRRFVLSPTLSHLLIFSTATVRLKHTRLSEKEREREEEEEEEEHTDRSYPHTHSHTTDYCHLISFGLIHDQHCAGIGLRSSSKR